MNPCLPYKKTESTNYAKAPLNLIEGKLELWGKQEEEVRKHELVKVIWEPEVRTCRGSKKGKGKRQEA